MLRRCYGTWPHACDVLIADNQAQFGCANAGVPWMDFSTAAGQRALATALDHTTAGGQPWQWMRGQRRFTFGFERMEGTVAHYGLTEHRAIPERPGQWAFQRHTPLLLLADGSLQFQEDLRQALTLQVHAISLEQAWQHLQVHDLGRPTSVVDLQERLWRRRQSEEPSSQGGPAL